MQEYKDPVLWTDSQYVIDAVKNYSSIWNATGRTKSGRKPKNLDLLKEIHEMCHGRKVTWKHVKAHSNHAGNDAADKLAKAGAKEDCFLYIDVIDG
jgi:ribonuclease HI